MINVIASDGHDTVHRPPCMDEAFEWLEENYSQETARLLCIDNPQAALDSQPMKAPSAGAAKKKPAKRGWLGSLFSPRESND